MKGFVFDLDNTLFDRYATLTKIVTENFDVIRPYINPAYDAARAAEHFCRTEAIYLPLKQNWYNLYDVLLQEHFFHPNNTPAARAAIGFLMDNYKKTAVNFPFIQELLAEIKAHGYKLGILTNGDHSLQQAKLDLLDISQYFDAIVISGDFAEKMGSGQNDLRWYKPDPSVFRYAAQQLDEQPEDLYYVGDNPINDVAGARAAGYVPVWVRSRGAWLLDANEMPEHVVNDISELTKLL